MTFLRLIGNITAGFVGLFTILIFGLGILAVKFAVIGFVIYFFLVLGGFVPPVDYIPFIPHI